MKKLALGIATLLFAATPAFACPDMEGGGHEKETKTADKKKEEPKKDSKGQTADKDKAKKDDKAAKPAPKKEEPKKDDKVSSK